MNKKGFTLVELLGVIVVLAIIIGIGTTGAISVSNKSKVKMYNSKVEMIVNAAKLYAQDNRKEFVNNGNVSVNTLNSKGYLKKDNDSGDIINPIDGSSLKNFSINVSKNNNRYVATINCNDNTWNKNNVLNNDIKSKYCQ